MYMSIALMQEAKQDRYIIINEWHNKNKHWIEWELKEIIKYKTRKICKNKETGNVLPTQNW